MKVDRSPIDWESAGRYSQRKIMVSSPASPHQLRLTVHQLQKHFYRYLRMVQKGLHILISESKRKPTPMAVLIPHNWYVKATAHLTKLGDLTLPVAED